MITLQQPHDAAAPPDPQAPTMRQRQWAVWCKIIEVERPTLHSSHYAPDARPTLTTGLQTTAAVVPELLAHTKDSPPP